MATVDKRVRRLTPQPVQVAPPPKPQRRKPWRFMIACVVLATLVWLLPGIIAHTPMLSWGVRTFGKLNGDVSIQSASLGWFSPINISGVEVRDAQHQPVLQLAGLKSEKTLAGLLCDLSKLGTFRLERPTLTLLLRNDGSNVEDLIARLLTGESSNKHTGLSLEIIDGSLTIVDQELKQQWEVNKLNVALCMTNESAWPTKVEVSAAIAGMPRPGSLALKASITPRAAVANPAANGLANTDGSVRLQADAVPLAMFQRLASRFAPQTQLAGTLRSDVDLQWTGLTKVGLKADVETNEFAINTQAIGKDIVQMKRIGFTCRAAQQAGRLELQTASLDCDVGKLEAVGSVNLSNNTATLQPVGKLQGQLDLAKLARLLPDTLRIRQGTEITGGQIELAVQSTTADGNAWQGELTTHDLKAVNQGSPFTWDHPISIQAAAHRTPQGAVVDRVECKSDFLTIDAQGTPDQLTASLRFSLKRLADELGQFVDLRGLKLEGDGTGGFEWKRAADSTFVANGQFKLQDFQLANVGRQPWIEENVTVTLSAKGKIDLGANTRVDSALVQIDAKTDQLQIEVAQPVADLKDGGKWPLVVRMRGRLDRWPARLATFVDTQNWRMGGGYQLAAQAVASKDAIALTSLKLTADQVAVASPQCNVNEQAIELTAVGRCGFQPMQVRIDNASFRSSAVAAEVGQVVLSKSDAGNWEATGAAMYRADLNRLQPWFADATKAATWQMGGQLVGTAQLQQTAGVIQCRTQADITELVVATASGQVREPKVHFDAQGTYQPKDGVLQLTQLQLTSNAATVNATAQVGQANNQTTAEINGDLAYDWERVCGLARPWLSPAIRIVGRGKSDIKYRGPLALDKGQAAAAIRWDGANVYGFRVGPGEMKAQMAEGILRVEPLQLACNRGRVLLAPQVRLAPGSMQLAMPAGPLVEQVEIDPEMCEHALKFVAPILASATSVKGAFSIQLDRCRIPFDDPSKGDLAGRFIIHSVEVGPGPLIQELAILLNRTSAAKLKRESVVTFQMHDGRVFHKGLELEFPDVTILTEGSVGFDQTLSMKIQMPIPTKWIAGTSVGNALKNKAIELPLGGTLAKPQLDRARMAQVNKDIIGSAARGVMQSEVGKQLDRLFGPAPSPTPSR